MSGKEQVPFFDLALIVESYYQSSFGVWFDSGVANFRAKKEEFGDIFVVPRVVERRKCRLARLKCWPSD